MDIVDRMRAFVAVARAESFTGAAKADGRSVKAMSQAVAQLEVRLGVQLLHRTTRKVALTDAGAAYLPRCEALIDEFDALEADVADRARALSGRIRLTAPVHLGQTRLAEALSEFMTKHPGVEIDLELTYRRVDLVGEGFDLAVRSGALPDSALTARKLGASQALICASDAYLSARGRPCSPSDLSNHDCCLDTNLPEPDRWRFRRDGEDVIVRVKGRFRSNAPGGAAVIARAGLGVARLPMSIASQDVADGRLIPLLEDYAPPPVELYAVYPPSRHPSARLRALIEHLARRL